MTEHTRRRVRAGLVYLTASFLAVGLWATLNPSSFYDSFPGAGRHWVAGDGPYNAHLVGDAGVGFLAVGLVSHLAAVWMDIRVIQAASGAVLVHDAPHLLFHLRHPNESLESGGHMDEQRRTGLRDAHRTGDPRRGQAGRRERGHLPPPALAYQRPAHQPRTPRAQLSEAIPINKEES